MTKSTIISIIGGSAFVVLLVGAIFFASGRGASASRQGPADLRGATQAEATQDVLTAAEAHAWAEARAAGTPAAYRVYLAAYPTGAFAQEAQTAIDAAPPPAPAKAKARAAATASPAPVVVASAAREPVRIRDIAGECRAYVDAHLSAPSRVGRTVGGAAGGCAVGMLAGGDDGRNCVVGAIAGGATGALTAENRERRRRQEIDACIAHGGPPG